MIDRFSTWTPRGGRPERVATDSGQDVSMVEPVAEIADIIIDCLDPVRLAAFWADLLGRQVEGSKGPYVWLQRPAGAAGVGFQKVTEPKTGKNRVHLDISV